MPKTEPLFGEPREDLALDRDGATRRDEIEHLGLEHVEAGVDQVGVDLLGPRLLEERLDTSVRGGANEPVSARIGDRREQDRRLGAGRAMERHQLAEVGLAQRVAVEREEALVELAPGEADRSPGAERLVLDRVVERQAVVVGAEARLDLIRQVPARDDGMLDAVPSEMLERIGEERPVDERQHVLARAIGERSEPRALPSDEDDRRKAHTTGRPMPS